MLTNCDIYGNIHKKQEEVSASHLKAKGVFRVNIIDYYLQAESFRLFFVYNTILIFGGAFLLVARNYKSTNLLRILK